MTSEKSRDIHSQQVNISSSSSMQNIKIQHKHRVVDDNNNNKHHHQQKQKKFEKNQNEENFEAQLSKSQRK